MEFLFDDEWVDRKVGVRRVNGQPVKQQAPVLEPEMAWEAEGVHPCQAVLYDSEERRFKMWYRGIFPASLHPAWRIKPAGGQGVEPSEWASLKRLSGVCYAESDDGLRWRRPAVGLVEFQGSRENNILQVLPEGDSVFFNVTKDSHDPDTSRRYKALGFQYSYSADLDAPRGGYGIGVAFSPDGLNWTKRPGLVLTTKEVTDCDCILPRRDPATGKWVGFFRPRTQPKKRRFVGYSQSDDFEHWTLPRMLLTPDHSDDEWTEFYGMAATAVQEWRVGCLWVFHNNPAFSPMTTELAYSRDGRNYRRAMPRHEFVPLGPDGAPDSVMISVAAIVEHGNEFLLYYHGSNADHGSDRGLDRRSHSLPPAKTAHGEPHRSIFGVARLPWGQFCGLRADGDGMVETKYLCNYGRSGVKALATVENGGAIAAEILDQYGEPIPGWGATSSRARADDRGISSLHWGREELIGRPDQTSDEKGTVGHVVKLRFHLHKATLYGFQAGDTLARPSEPV